MTTSEPQEVNEEYWSPWIIDRMGFNMTFAHQFEPSDLDDRSTKEFIMEQVCAEHWFEGTEH